VDTGLLKEDMMVELPGIVWFAAGVATVTLAAAGVQAWRWIDGKLLELRDLKTENYWRKKACENLSDALNNVLRRLDALEAAKPRRRK
jgi:hypothetical protein